MGHSIQVRFQRTALGAAIAASFCGGALAASAPGLPIGDEFRVNTLTTNGQISADVAADAHGNYVVVWNDVNDLQSIRARRFDALGHPLGDEFQVNEPTTALGRILPRVAMDAAGDFVVVWENFWQTPGNVISARRYDASGNPRGRQFALNTYGYAVRFPDVAMQPDGDFVGVWDVAKGPDHGEEFEVVARRFNAFGRPKDATEFLVQANSLDNGRAPAVAMDATGDFAVAWLGGNYLGDGTVERDWRVRRFSRSGTARDAQDIVLATGAHYLQRPGIAMNAVGDFAVGWDGLQANGSEYRVDVQRFGPKGTKLGGVLHATEAGYDPALSLDADRNLVVAWREANGQEVYARRYAGPLPQGSIIHVDDHLDGIGAANGQEPALAIDPNGDVLIAWTASQGDQTTDADIYIRRYAGPENVDLAVSMSDVPDPALETQPVDYTVTVTNQHPASVMPGQGVATNISAAFTLDVSTGFTLAGDHWACEAAGATSENCHYDLPLDPGASTSFVVTAAAPDDLPSTTPSVTVAGGQFDANTLNDGASETTTVSGPDISPAPFTFPPKQGLPGAYARSATVTISGVSDPVGISLSGDASARWSKNGGSFRSAPGTVQNGDTVYVRLLVPASGEASVTVTVGSYSTVYTVSPR